MYTVDLVFYPYMLPPLEIEAEALFHLSQGQGEGIREAS